MATADENESSLVRSIVDRYLGTDDDAGAAAPDDEAMSVTSETLKRTRDRVSLSDSDIDDRPTKGRKILRSRVIGSDSEDANPIVLSDSPEGVSVKVCGRKKTYARSRKRDIRLDGSIDFANLEFTPCPARLVQEDLQAKDTDNRLSGIANNWLSDMELIRTKSKNLNGRLSGYLRDRIDCVRSFTQAHKKKVSGSVKQTNIFLCILSR